MIDVRRLRSDEGQILKQLRLRALTEDPDSFAERMPEVAMRPNDYWEDLAAEVAVSDERITYLAEFEGRPVGMLGAQVVDSTTVELKSMWTEPLVRRRGAGRRLLDAATGWAREAGRTEAVLWVLAANDGAQRMYERYGFAVVGGVVRPAAAARGDEARMRLDL